MALVVACAGFALPVHAAQTTAPATLAAPVTMPNIVVSGVPMGAPAVQKIINQAYRKAVTKVGASRQLDPAQWQQLLADINTALHAAGYANAHAYLSTQLATFSVPGAKPVAAPAFANGHVLPDMRQRQTATGAAARVAVRGFVVDGVGQHADAGITPKGMQAFADQQFAKLGGGAGHMVKLSFAQLQSVADAITHRYRKAGFIVATAYLPVQTVAADGIIRIDVLEGTIGRIIVKGTKHYRPWVISASAQKLRGKALRKRDVETALLYDRDLPGVSVSSTFQPGEKTGQTDLIMLAREAKHPFAVTLGASNYGTPATGRYRTEAQVDWLDPTGLGDQLSVGVNYALDPHQNTYGSLAYTLPFVKVPGLAMSVGASRSQLQLNNGTFSALHIKGPTSRYFGGLGWKFVNRRDLSMRIGLKYVHEQSSLKATTLPLSDERFNVAQVGFSMKHADRRFHGIGMLSARWRHSLNDESRMPDLVSPNHARRFDVFQLDYTRVQFLSRDQQLYFKFAGQYSRDALVPMEQFSIGGPDSVRAYPIAEDLADRGFYSALEYHVNAPGFAYKPSPFHGIPWQNLLTLEGFVDFARGYAVGADNAFGGETKTYRGAGVGLIFRLPQWHQLLFHLDVSRPLGGLEASDHHDYRVYGRFDLTF
ncbi:MAG TPA: ShlB/FhaC/HecB family hemolysin secretion/activation protein [Rhodanobacteraceae bacterium]